MFFFFNDTATTEIYTLSLHDALPISIFNDYIAQFCQPFLKFCVIGSLCAHELDYRIVDIIEFFKRPIINCKLTVTHYTDDLDRKSTRLNSSHANISYAVFCLKKKKTR